MKFYTYLILSQLLILQSCNSGNNDLNRHSGGTKKTKETQSPSYINNNCELDSNYINLKSIQEPTIIYIVYPDTWKDEVSVVAPLVIFKDNKYYEPHYCDCQSHDRLCDLNKKNDSLFLLYPLYLLNTKNASQEFFLNETSVYGLSSWIRPCAKIEKVALYNLLTNNPDLVINRQHLVAPNDRPVLPKRKQDYSDGFYKDELIGQVDINMDAIPELIYSSETFEGVYYQIYSKEKKLWRLVYKGSYNGV